MTCHESDYLMGSSDKIQILYSLVIFSFSCRKCFVYNPEAVGSVRMKREVHSPLDLTGDYTNWNTERHGCLTQKDFVLQYNKNEDSYTGQFSFSQFSRDNCKPKGLA